MQNIHMQFSYKYILIWIHITVTYENKSPSFFQVKLLVFFATYAVVHASYVNKKKQYRE